MDKHIKFIIFASNIRNKTSPKLSVNCQLSINLEYYFEMRQQQQQIESGISERDIRKSWEDGLIVFKEMRKKYLIY